MHNIPAADTFAYMMQCLMKEDRLNQQRDNSITDTIKNFVLIFKSWRNSDNFREMDEENEDKEKKILEILV